MFEAVASVGFSVELCGEHAAVVGEGGFGESMFVTCGYEGVDDVGAGFVFEGFASDDKA